MSVLCTLLQELGFRWRASSRSLLARVRQLIFGHGDLGCRKPLSRKHRFLRNGGRLATAQLISLSIFAFGNSQIRPAAWRAPSILLSPIGICLVFFALQRAAIVIGRHQVFYIAHSKEVH